LENKKYDLIIVGGGPGGYVAAIRSSQLGLSTALIEAEHLGGVCLNWGCIPTKALLRTAEIYNLIKHSDEFGITAENISFDLDKIVKRSRNVSKKLSQGVEYLLKKNKVDIIEGWGKLAGQENGYHQLTIENNTSIFSNVESKNIILATGSRARQLPGLEADGKLIWTYREAMVPKKLPQSLLIIGAGAIGIEYASFYQTLGTSVTVVESLDRILPLEDKEISDFAHKAFESRGVNICTNTTVSSMSTKEDSVKVITDSRGENSEITVDRVIIAVGIVGNYENIGLDQTSIEVNKSHIVVDDWCATAETGIWAIGDLVGPPWLAHKAEHEAIICVNRIAGIEENEPLMIENIPSCIYSQPQIASIGLTEETAKSIGKKIRVGKFPFQGNGKAIALGETEGFVKTIFDSESGEIIGAHLIGSDVTELIHGYSIAKTLESTEEELMRAVFPHPTLSEMMQESVMDAYDRAIHI